MARTFDARNKALPVAVLNMADQQPACFSSRESWVEWLDSNYHATLGDGRARSAINRGQVPDFCCDCTRSHEARMTEQGRCAKAIRRTEVRANLNAKKEPA